MSEFVTWKIKRERFRLGLSMHEFAEKVGVSKLTVFKWEHGIFSPSPKSIRKISKATNQPIEYFYSDDGQFSHSGH